MKTIGELFGDDFLNTYDSVFDSVMPGGEGWRKVEECLRSCPFHDRCNNFGPSGKLCSDDWKSASAKPIAIHVLQHVFENFDYYNRGDYEGSPKLVSDISAVLDIDFLEDASPSEAQRMVSVRLIQAEFKANLFERWGGCSLDNIDVPSEYLIASHIKPWAKCSTRNERVSSENGFLLPANYDYVFDRFLISFDDEGNMLFLNSKTHNQLYVALGIDRSATIRLKATTDDFFKFLAFHRDQFELKRKNLELR